MVLYSLKKVLGLNAGNPLTQGCVHRHVGNCLQDQVERGNSRSADFLRLAPSMRSGVSGFRSEMRTLLMSADPHARDAIGLYGFRIVREVGALAASLGGLDAFVFAVGIREQSPEIGRRVCEGAPLLRIELDPVANEAGGPGLTRLESRVSAWVIPTDEDRRSPGIRGGFLRKLHGSMRNSE